MLLFDLDGTLIDSNGVWRKVDEVFLARLLSENNALKINIQSVVSGSGPAVFRYTGGKNRHPPGPFYFTKLRCFYQKFLPNGGIL